MLDKVDLISIEIIHNVNNCSPTSQTRINLPGKCKTSPVQYSSRIDLRFALHLYPILKPIGISFLGIHNIDSTIVAYKSTERDLNFCQKASAEI